MHAINGNRPDPHAFGQSYQDIVRGAEQEALAGALENQQLRIGGDILQSAIESPGTLDTSHGTLGVGSGDHVAETGAEGFPLPPAAENQ